MLPTIAKENITEEIASWFEEEIDATPYSIIQQMVDYASKNGYDEDEVSDFISACIENGASAIRKTR